MSLGGTEGNARLTAATAVVLLVLLAAEGLTIPFLGQQLTLHFVLGVALIPVVLVKMGATAWRFARYYSGSPEYVAKGPPQVLMRLLVAPLTVVSTLGLFGTGVLLIALNPQKGFLLTVHKASFIVWVAAMSAHVLGHVLKVPKLAIADFEHKLPGTALRQFLVAGAIVIGLIAAVAVIPDAHTWEQWAALHHHHDH
jgi:hypothetical protein